MSCKLVLLDARLFYSIGGIDSLEFMWKTLDNAKPHLPLLFFLNHSHDDKLKGILSGSGQSTFDFDKTDFH